jgi:hypothetical protein
MRIFAAILLLLFSQPTIIAGIPCTKCDIEKVKLVNDRLDSLSLQLISDFLCTFDSSCASNVEYSEWSNETLFKVMQKAPTLFFQVIEREFLNSNLLLQEIRSPINDGIDLQLTYDRLKRGKAKVEIKAKYLEALKVAAKKENIELKE